jgi:hypothetical protein
MTTKPKPFDCVEMKHQAQREIAAEWEGRKHEFRSYEEFLRASIRQTEWGRATWHRLGPARQWTCDSA